MHSIHTRVLVVVDSATIRGRLSDLLTQLETVEVVGQASDALEALELARQLHPNVITLDLHMPGGSGLDLIPRLKELVPSPIVMVLTNYPYAAYRKRATEAGADFFFDKSTEFHQVLVTLRDEMAVKRAVDPDQIELPGISKRRRIDVLAKSNEATTGEVIPRPGAIAPANGERALILVVDDNSAVRSTLSRLLRAEGFEVSAEANGKGALDSVRLLRPDVVLLDVMLPDCDGFEVCRRLREDPETRLTPVMMLTGLANEDSLVQGLESGADDFLTKPPRRLELLARVRSLLRMRHYTNQLERTESVLLVLGRSIEGKDPYTEGHCERLSARATELGKRIGLSADEITALDRAGIVHDIGKIAVPDAILLKRGQLTPDEWTIMRKHPVTGEHICGPIHSFRLVLPIIRHHHEKYDGSGYPDALSGKEIPTTARVLQVVDVYDALTTERPYKPALSRAEALKTMRSEVDKGWWDSKLVAEFERLTLDRKDGG